MDWQQWTDYMLECQRWSTHYLLEAQHVHDLDGGTTEHGEYLEACLRKMYWADAAACNSPDPYLNALVIHFARARYDSVQAQYFSDELTSSRTQPAFRLARDRLRVRVQELGVPLAFVD